MKLLIGGSSSKFFHLKEFADSLNKFGVETKLVVDSDIYDGFPSRKISNWFQTKARFNRLIDEFKPNAIFVDRQRHFSLAASKTKIPLFMLLRGDFWNEIEQAKKTLYRSIPKRIAIDQWQKIGEECLSHSTVILPICRYLEVIVKTHYPNKPTEVLYQGISPSRWFPTKPMDLKHPCIGLLQDANFCSKIEEMPTFAKVVESMKDVMFYWAGDGPFRDQVLSVLGKYENFKWLGRLQYPDKVREFLAGIDIYALVTGMDMSPLTLQEAQLMERPVIATSVGGVTELMQDERTGFQVEKGDYKRWKEKISILLNDKEKAKQIGTNGRNFVKDNFNWDGIARRFVDIMTDCINKSTK